MSSRIARDASQLGKPSGEFVQGLKRGFDVIKAFSADAPRLTITDVAERTGLTRAVARRYLLTLHTLGCVAQENATFWLTPRILDLGFTYLSTIDVADLAQRSMERVAQVLHETCSLGVLDGSDLVYIGRVPAKRIMTINLVVGSRLPAYSTSLGKVLLAHLSAVDLDRFFQQTPLKPLTRRTICDERRLRAELDQVRLRGWAISDQETEDGVRTVAVPIVRGGGTIVAAMNVSGHASRVTVKELRGRYLPVLRGAAAEVSLLVRPR